jgi:hypothetical protein
MRRKKLIFILIAFILMASAFTPLLIASAQEEREQNLEIVYPRIPGEATPPTVISEGLPNYIKYIFNFSIAIIGIIVFGVLIYNGLQYILSTGSPEKLGSAKKGITSALIGIVILFSAALLFNTINPQLTVLEAELPDIIEPVIAPGIYLCNYKVDNIKDIVKRYYDENSTQEERIAAAKEFKTKIRNGDNVCFRVAFSGNISFSFIPSIHSVFAVPRKEYVSIPATEENPAGTGVEWKYDYGIIFHQKDDFRGKCEIVEMYEEIRFPIFSPLPSVRSVTLFEKPAEAPESTQQQGVTLYQCLDYNQTGSCPEGLKETQGTPDEKSFPTTTTDSYFTEVLQGELGNLDFPTENEKNINGTRSIQIDREGYYFAVLFSAYPYDISRVCEVISEDDNNLLDQPIGQCYFGRLDECNGLFDWNKDEEYLRDCRPCTNSLIVIKGNVIK